jgi:abortive infection bacteriophage resistance protein
MIITGNYETYNHQMFSNIIKALNTARNITVHVRFRTISAQYDLRKPRLCSGVARIQPGCRLQQKLVFHSLLCLTTACEQARSSCDLIDKMKEAV